MRQKFIFGNWKMNGTNSDVREFFKNVNLKLDTNEKIIMGLGLPFTSLETGLECSKKVKIAAQNVHFAEKGAYTGEISIPMLKEIGIEYVIIGHSERREMFNEQDEDVNKKALALLQNNMVPIICCGESLTNKESGKTISFVNKQISEAYKNINADQAIKTIIAYEPIWAIGTGKTATSQDAQDVIGAIRKNLLSIYSPEVADKISILYGGSVKSDNISELMKQKDIDGALVGGASLIYEEYLALSRG